MCPYEILLTRTNTSWENAISGIRSKDSSIEKRVKTFTSKQWGQYVYAIPQSNTSYKGLYFIFAIVTTSYSTYALLEQDLTQLKCIQILSVLQKCRKYICVIKFRFLKPRLLKKRNKKKKLHCLYNTQMHRISLPSSV
jgi:hypothetical protein